MRAPEPLPPAIAADLAAMDAAVEGRSHAGGDPVLAELARLVHEERPAPGLAAAQRLDSRTAAAMRPSAGRRARRRPIWLMPALGACASLVLVVVVVAVAVRGGDGSSAGAGAGAGLSTADSTSAARSESAPDASSGSSSGGAGGGSRVPPSGPATPGRAVERSTSMRLATRPSRIDEVASGAARVATGLGGYVASSNVTGGEGASLDLRVPGARLDQAVERLSQLARVRHLERSTLDITDQLTTARQRVQDARAERRSLLKQLAAADSDREAARIRARLTAVTRRLEQARATVRELRNRADYATVGVEIVPERRHGAAAGGGHWSPGDALHDAARVLEVAAGVALVALAVALPLGLVGIPAWIAGRRLARRRREHVLDFA